ncbi:winged helix-turn-helix transcriptional regulator [Actinomycetes bacterium M1A6_2h]
MPVPLLDVIANKWSALAIGALEPGPQRLGELRRTLEEGAELVSRTVYAVVPLHVEYELTELGRSAVGPLSAMREWAEANHDLASRLARSLRIIVIRTVAKELHRVVY